MDVKQRIAEISHEHGWNEWREECICGEECSEGRDEPGTFDHHLADMLVDGLSASGLVIIEEAAIPAEHPGTSILDELIDGLAKRLDGTTGRPSWLAQLESNQQPAD